LPIVFQYKTSPSLASVASIIPPSLYPQILQKNQIYNGIIHVEQNRMLSWINAPRQRHAGHVPASGIIMIRPNGRQLIDWIPGRPREWR
jgi:hypothetical protein